MEPIPDIITTIGIILAVLMVAVIIFRSTTCLVLLFTKDSSEAVSEKIAGLATVMAGTPGKAVVSYEKDNPSYHYLVEFAKKIVFVTTEKVEGFEPYSVCPGEYKEMLNKRAATSGVEFDVSPESFQDITDFKVTKQDDNILVTSGSGTITKITTSTVPPVSGRTCSEKGVVASQDGKFVLNGKEFKFIGAQAGFLLSPEFEKKNDNEIKAVFDSMINDCGISVVRLFITDQILVGRVERILDLTKDYNIKFILVLGDAYGGAENGRLSTGWYQGEYKGSARYPDSYEEFVRNTVEKLKVHKNGIFAWELLNEPHCGYGINKRGEKKDGDYNPDCPPALLNFMKDMSNYIKSIDPVHMVTVGVIGQDQYGASPVRENTYTDDTGKKYRDFGYMVIHEAPAVDAAEAHYYINYDNYKPSDLIDKDIEISKSLNKPFFIEEAGASIKGCDRSKCSWGCEGKDERADRFKAYMEDIFNKGGKGFVVWSYSYNYPCGPYAIHREDPVCRAMKEQSDKLC